jgi:hypothetical protein
MFLASALVGGEYPLGGPQPEKWQVLTPLGLELRPVGSRYTVAASWLVRQAQDVDAVQDGRAAEMLPTVTRYACGCCRGAKPHRRSGLALQIRFRTGRQTIVSAAIGSLPPPSTSFPFTALTRGKEWPCRTQRPEGVTWAWCPKLWVATPLTAVSIHGQLWQASNTDCRGVFYSLLYM